MSESRTTKSIRNARVNVFYFLAQAIVEFWARKVFYEYLGSEVLGLTTTAQSLLQFLNIAESGIGTAVAYFLYTPLYNDDRLTLRKIVALQGWIYRRIATFILVSAMLLMLAFPWIFSDIKVPLWYAYATFSVILFGNMLGYYANYRSSILSADQKNYKVVKVTKLSKLLLTVLLVVALPYSSQPFLLYLSTTLAGSIIGSIWLNHVIRKEYPWLKSVEEKGKQLLKEYPGMLTKTKQLFVHKMAGYTVYQVTPLIMYSFSTLTLIAYYGNYLMIINQGKNIILQAFAGTNAAIGSVVASKDKNRMLNLFWELTDSRLFISTTSLFVLSLITEDFISIWLSPDYLLNKSLLFLIILTTWLFLNRSVVEAYKNAFGIFQDVWAPLAECMITVSVSIICGYIFGITGVLLGSLASLLTIVYGWKPYFLFTAGFQLSCIQNYYRPYFRRILLVVVTTVPLYLVISRYDYSPKSFYSLAVYAIIIAAIATVYFYTIFFLCLPGMRLFNHRIIGLLKKRKSK